MNKQEQVNIKVHPDLRASLKQLAIAEGRTMTSLLKLMIEDRTKSNNVEYHSDTIENITIKTRDK